MAVAGKPLGEFMLDLSKFGSKTVPEAHLLVQKKIALQVLTGIIRKTPVDTGRARSNWQIAVVNPPEGVKASTDKQGANTIAAGLGELANAKPYGIVWIGNNLPYIVELEHGHSKQAPNGMVALTIAEIQTFYGGGL